MAGSDGRQAWPRDPKQREEHATGQKQARDNPGSDGAHYPVGGAMLSRSSRSGTLLESAVAKNAAAKPVECAITKLLDLKSFRICSYKKCGGGEHQRCAFGPA